MWWSWQEEVIKPEGDSGKRRARCDHGARKCDGILPQKVDWLGPLADALSLIHLGIYASFSS
jgi:hypothetical protein